MDFTTKVVSKIMKSSSYNKSYESPFRSKAAVTRHQFDDLEITEAHNGQAEYKVYIRGENLGSIPRNQFHSAVELRKNNQLQSFMNS